MSISRTVNITCPSCSMQQDVRLYDAIDVRNDPELKDALMKNQLNRIECVDCDDSFRVDMPLLYNDPENKMLIHWIPETAEMDREQVLEDFDLAMEQMNGMLRDGEELPCVRLVLTRIELIELIFIVEAGMNQRAVEYVKYSIHTRNMDAVDPHKYRLLLNVQDSTDEELHFVMHDVQEQKLGKELRYGRAAYNSICELHEEDPDEFLEMFPGPCISARNLLLEDEHEA